MKLELFLILKYFNGESIRYQKYGTVPLEVVNIFENLNFQKFKNSISAELVFRRIFLKVRFEMKN